MDKLASLMHVGASENSNLLDPKNYPLTNYHATDKLSQGISSFKGSDYVTTALRIGPGILLKTITRVTGLWNPRKRGYTVMCAVVLALNIASMLTEIIIPSICGVRNDDCVTGLTSHNGHLNQSRSIRKVLEVTLGLDVWTGFANSLTFALLVCTLWRTEREFPLATLSSAHAKLTTKECILIASYWITCPLLIILAFGSRIAAVEYEKRHIIGALSACVFIIYVTAFTCCSAFLILTCALGRFVDKFFQELCDMRSGDINDVICMHQRLSRQLLTACRYLMRWFIVHWVVFGVNCLAVFAFDAMHFSLLSRVFRGAPAGYMVTVLFMNFLIFLVPCVSASRVTWKCDGLLYSINNRCSHEWNEGHAFRDRASLNEFLFYAERSKCGYRIGNMMFGSSATWMSVFLGILGIGIRLVIYMN